MKRFPLRAFLLAPLVPGLVWAIAVGNPVVLLFAVPLSYAVALFVGLPLYWVIGRCLRVTLASCIVGGALAAVLAMSAIWLFDGSMGRWPADFLQGAALFAAFGGVAGACFWFLSGWRLGGAGTGEAKDSGVEDAAVTLPPAGPHAPR